MKEMKEEFTIQSIIEDYGFEPEEKKPAGRISFIKKGGLTISFHYKDMTSANFLKYDQKKVFIDDQYDISTREKFEKALKEFKAKK